MGMAGAFKMLKGDLKKEGCDLAHISEPAYVPKPGADAYASLDAAFAERIRAG